MSLISTWTLAIRLAGVNDDYRAFQWQPTLTSHDPNPPITLESAGAQSFTYAGAIDGQSAVAATWRVTWNPAELIAAQSAVAAIENVTRAFAGEIPGQSTVTVIEKTTRVLAGLVAGQSEIAATLTFTLIGPAQLAAQAEVAGAWAFIANPVELVDVISGITAPSSVTRAWAGQIDAQATVPGAYVFQSSGPATFSYAGAIDGIAGIIAEVVFAGGMGSRSTPWPRRRRRKKTYVYHGAVASHHRAEALTAFVASAPPPADVFPTVDALIRAFTGSVPAQAGVAARTRWDDAVAPILQQDDELLEMLVL